ncbi:MAG: hypothetical protein ACE15F_04785 [bacterium]
MMFVPAVGFSHQPFAAYIQHQAELRVSTQTIDIELELTFHNVLALSEREVLDADGDEQISRREIGLYLTARAEEFARNLSVLINQRPVAVIPLYEPRLDLLADTRVAPTPLILLLHHFCRVPEGIGSGWTVELDDRLFPHEPAVCAWHCTAAEGITLVEEPDSGLLLSADSGATPRRVVVRTAASNFPSPSIGPVLSKNNTVGPSHLIQAVLAVPWMPALGIGPAMAILPAYMPWNQILTINGEVNDASIRPNLSR